MSHRQPRSAPPITYQLRSTQTWNFPRSDFADGGRILRARRRQAERAADRVGIGLRGIRGHTQRGLGSVLFREFSVFSLYGTSVLGTDGIHCFSVYRKARNDIWHGHFGLSFPVRVTI